MQYAEEVCDVHPTQGYEWADVDIPHGLLWPREPMSDGWVIPSGSLVTKERGRRHKKAAFPAFGLSDLLMLSPDAADALAPLLHPYGELLPVSIDGGPASIFHCTYVVDAVDIPLSKPFYSVTYPGKILSFDRPAFKPDTIPEGCAFRLPESQPSSTYYTGSLIRKIMHTVDTSGIEFDTIWTAEEGPVRRAVS